MRSGDCELYIIHFIYPLGQDLFTFLLNSSFISNLSPVSIWKLKLFTFTFNLFETPLTFFFVFLKDGESKEILSVVLSDKLLHERYDLKAQFS